MPAPRGIDDLGEGHSAATVATVIDALLGVQLQADPPRHPARGRKPESYP